MRLVRMVFCVLLVSRAAPAAECAFVATSGIDAVTVVDALRGEVTGHLPAGTMPTAVAVTADGQRAYVVNTEARTVSVLDLATRRSLATIPVGAFPNAIALHPDGQRAYVVERYENRLAVIDTATNAVVRHVSTSGVLPGGIAITRDGRRGFVANSDSESVGILDLTADRPLGSLLVGKLPFDVALTPDDAFLYVGNAEAGSVSVVRTDDPGVVATIPVGGFPIGIAVHPSGSFAYVANAPVGDVTVIDDATHTVLTTIPVAQESSPTELASIAMLADGSAALATDYVFGNLYALDTRAHAVRGFTSLRSNMTAPERVVVARLAGRCPISPDPLLTAAIDASAATIPLERADLLPFAGTLRIDDELLAYEGAFRRESVLNAARGARGTIAAEHLPGTPCHLVGRPGDASCDGPTTAADVTALITQIPAGDPAPCGGDLQYDGTVDAADLPPLLTAIFAVL